ncbi:MAG: hypothetical protein ONB06_10885 [candidate division KSB1 bacterium]|nr:hypothetical protein [candidate division KSB1 bacterium]
MGTPLERTMSVEDWCGTPSGRCRGGHAHLCHQ